MASAVVLAYLPGLPGTFLFDDYANLPLLGAFGGVHDWPSLLLYATSGIADPTGRPVAQLSFLLDARNWPADVLPFKRTNIAIHVLNAMLLAWALHRLGLRTGLTTKTSLVIGMGAAALWALHPLHVSTVLYIVQRHAQLVLLFFLLCAIALDYAATAITRDRKALAAVLISCALIALGLALFSKSNGILVPLLVGLIYLHVKRVPAGNTRPERTYPRWADASFAGFAALSLAAVLVISAASVMDPGSSRPWEYWNRVLTQPRALIDYLGLLLIPRIGSPGIFTDGYPLSTGFLSPWTTLAALSALVTLVGYSVIKLRQRALALALGFFFVGHLLESGFVNLELFYEHRNYLPSVLLFWAFARLLVTSEGQLPARRAGVIVAVACLLALLTALRASSWASPQQIAAVSERHATGSERLALMATSLALRQGRADIAAERARIGLRRQPSSALLGFNLLTAECAMDSPTSEAADLTAIALRQSYAWDRNLYHWISERIDDAGTTNCAHYRLDALEKLALSLQASPVTHANPDAAQDSLALSAEIALAAGRNSSARDLFGRALAALPRYDAALWLAQRARQLGGAEIAATVFAAARRCLPPPPLPALGMPRLHAWLLERFPAAEAGRVELEQRLAELPEPSESELAAFCAALAARE